MRSLHAATAGPQRAGQRRELGLEGCRRIDDAAAAELVNWKSLKYLDLQDTQVTHEGVEALRKAKPATGDSGAP